MVYGIPVIVTPEDGTFHPRMEDVLEAVTGYTRAIIVNSPNNPSGVLYSREFIGELIEFCESKGIYVIMDDIYHRLVFDGREWPSPYQFTQRDIDNSHVLVVNGVSKVYGMTGYRIGWTIAPRKMVEVMTNVQAQTTSAPPCCCSRLPRSPERYAERHRKPAPDD